MCVTAYKHTATLCSDYSLTHTNGDTDIKRVYVLLYLPYKYCMTAYSYSHSYVLVCVCAPHTGQFQKGLAEGAVDPSFNPVVALRLSVLKDSAVWAIISEVSQSRTAPAPITGLSNS